MVSVKIMQIIKIDTTVEVGQQADSLLSFSIWMMLKLSDPG